MRFHCAVSLAARLIVSRQFRWVRSGESMSILSFALIVSGVLLNAMAQLWLKAGTNALGTLDFRGNAVLSTTFRVGMEPHILAGLACYALSVGIWIVALSKVPVSMAYPMLSIGYVVNAIAAWYLFGEYISVQRMAGIAIIIVGVYLVARS
ncbi:SMR family transporter [Caballeronia glathei]|uniref:SMR family transporter n=1 Tax=Caballeronia glathei TaxID=60547 RepID=UPI003F9B5B05